MATDQRNTIANFNTDADFRSFCSDIIAQLTGAGGLTQTADTGQINTATVTKPAALSTAQGYVILRFSDTLQASQPVYLKVEFGSGSGGATSPGLWVTMGTGSNGSGTITGTVTTRRQIGLTAGQTPVAGTSQPSYCCGTPGGVGYVGVWAAAAGLTFIVDRTRDGAGNATADGAILFCSSSGGGGTYLMSSINYAASTAINTTAAQQFSPGSNQANTIFPNLVGTNVCVVPFMSQFGKLFFSLMIHMGYTTNTPNGSYSVTTLGGAHTFQAFTIPSAPSSNANDSLLMLWE